MATPLISVLIPAYNAESYIVRCVESILNQTMADLEILVYDDGSIDRTVDLMAQFKDERVTLFQGLENKGVVHARNFLLARARGTYIALQDADDWSDRERLARQLECLASYPHLGACGSQFIKMVNGRPVASSTLPTDPEIIKRAIPENFYFLPASLFVRRSVMDEIGGYNPYFGNHGCEDTYLVSKIVLACGYMNIDYPAYIYNLNVHSLTKLGESATRRIYLSDINRALLHEWKTTGTNALESGDARALEELEQACRRHCRSLRKFDVFEKVIGQLLFYRQYSMAAREVVKYGFRTRELVASARLLVYVLRKSLRYES